MTRSSGKRPYHFKNTLPADPAVQRMGDWHPGNRDFYARFRTWLKLGGYSYTALSIYGVATRIAIGFLKKPYWKIDPDTDLELVREHLRQRYASPSTRLGYLKGLRKFEEFLRQHRRQPARAKPIRWEHYIGTLPAMVQEQVREFIHWRQCFWKEEQRYELALSILSHLTLSLRWMAGQGLLHDIADVTPQAWYAYLDRRIAAGIRPRTVNGELSGLKHLIHYLREHEVRVCERFLLVEFMDAGGHLPKDASPGELRRLQETIQAEAACVHSGKRRRGRLDLAWFLLMLHSGLRSAEVRNLKLQNIEWEQRRLRIEQAKGLKDRLVYLSQAALDALKAYLEVRGPADVLPENVFISLHQPLSKSYCFEKLRTYGKRCGVHVTPHQLRFSCATLLLNAGAPVLAVQAILGHKNVDTTLIYARLYDGTIAADYYRAMGTVERQLALPEDRPAQPISVGEMIALVDSLHSGALNPVQAEIVGTLRAGLASMADGQSEAFRLIDASTMNR